MGCVRLQVRILYLRQNSYSHTYLLGKYQQNNKYLVEIQLNYIYNTYMAIKETDLIKAVIARPIGILVYQHTDGIVTRVGQVTRVIEEGDVDRKPVHLNGEPEFGPETNHKLKFHVEWGDTKKSDENYWDLGYSIRGRVVFPQKSDFDSNTSLDVIW